MGMMEEALTDPFGRKITYLRVSVIDRCNLRCSYCMPPAGVKMFAHEDILTFEEIARVVRTAVKLGVTKVRITGGEPLVRRGIEQLVTTIGRISGIQDYALSTNGVLLAEKCRAIDDAGIQRVNLSLDTLRPERFRQITLRDDHSRVLEGLAAAEGIPFEKIKINTVVVRGFNDDEILDFARLSCNHPYTVRLIELMPIGRTEFWDRGKVVPALEMKERIETFGRLELVPEANPANRGPQQLFRLPGAKGEIGFITPLSEEFCGTCNRLRLTAHGQLRGCLISAGEVDLRQPLRCGVSDEELEELFRLAVSRKPEKHFINEPDRDCPSACYMSQVGG